MCTPEGASTGSLYIADSDAALSPSDDAKCAHWYSFENFLSITLETVEKMARQK